MDRGTYIAASGGLAQMRKLEIVNNNLANANTPGYKREILIGDEQSFDQTLAKAIVTGDPFARPDHERAPGTVNTRAVTDFSVGAIVNTGNPLDAALRNANDFFVINTADGGVQYTRAGNFTLNQEGEVVTPDGMRVAGDGGALIVNGPQASIAPGGDVRVNGITVGRLKVVHIDDPQQLERVGSQRFTLKSGAAAPPEVDPDLAPQSLEMANVNTVGSIVELIGTQRAFQMYTRMAESIDQLNQTSTTRIGAQR